MEISRVREEIEVKEARADRDAEHDRGEAHACKDRHRPVGRVDPHCDLQRTQDKLGDAGEESRLAQLVVGPDRHAHGGDAFAPGLDHVVDGVIKVGRHGEPHGRFSAVGLEATRDVGHVEPRQSTDDSAPHVLQDLLHEREVLDFAGLPVADHEVGATLEDRCDEFWNIAAVVLVVPVGIDDDVRTRLQAVVDPRRKCVAEPPIGGKTQDMRDSVFARNLYSAVRAAIVDDHDLDRIDPVDPGRDIFQRGRKRLFLVQARNLDHELHSRRPPFAQVVLKNGITKLSL